MLVDRESIGHQRLVFCAVCKHDGLVFEKPVGGYLDRGLDGRHLLPLLVVSHSQSDRVGLLAKRGKGCKPERYGQVKAL